ncbi:hypothetical protein [Leisingera sp. F5]|uniref:hypothetical protein n=1 Tax=Leisingera sp. F5 TaxID=1813816 RepID=UPI000AB991A3|nr:hypothetical protein [Leisingera sp. F5]
MFDLRDGIQRSAGALGVSPVDLATAISYETAGTFDPAKAGPTTQWGQHRGLIQFGEPQAQKYGADWDNPVGSQLGEDGAVVKYLRDTGVKPGMGLLDIYSAINAGGVGRYGASDASNGGAPGTVRDKVEQQMAGHRRKAEALFGGGSTPGFMAGGEGSDRMGAPMQQDQEQRGAFGIKPELAMALAGGFYNMSRPVSGDQFLQNAYQMRARGEKDAKATKSRNQTAEWLRGNGYGEFAELVDSGAVSAGDVFNVVMKERMQAPEDNRTNDLIEYEYAKAQGFDGSFVDFQQQKRAAGATQINNTVGGAGAPGLGKLSTDYGYVLDPATGGARIDPETGLPTAAPIPGSPAELEIQAQAAAAAERGGQANRSANIVLEDIDRALGQSEGWGTTGAVGGVLSGLGGTGAHDLQNTLRTVQANIGFDRLQQMREASPTGGALGAVSERELTELQAVLGSVQRSQSKEQLQRNLQRLRVVYDGIKQKAEAYPNAAEFGFEPAAPQGGVIPPGIAPEDWEFMTPEERALFQ